MHNKISGLNLVGLFLFCLLFLPAGCARSTGDSVDIGRIVNANKQVAENVSVSMLDAYKATVAAFKELGMPIIAEYGGGTSMGLKSRFADNNVAWVEIASVGAAVCRITVSVDVFADESRSQTILASILNNLPGGSAMNEPPKIREEAKQKSTYGSGDFQQPQQKDDSMPAETKPQQLKPLPKEDITEKSLL